MASLSPDGQVPAAERARAEARTNLALALCANAESQVADLTARLEKTDAALRNSEAEHRVMFEAHNAQLEVARGRSSKLKRRIAKLVADRQRLKEALGKRRKRGFHLLFARKNGTARRNRIQE